MAVLAVQSTPEARPEPSQTVAAEIRTRPEACLAPEALAKAAEAKTQEDLRVWLAAQVAREAASRIRASRVTALGTSASHSL